MKIKLGLSTILFLIFMILKLTNYIDWSWWWIASPLWIGAIIWVIAVIILVWGAVKSERKY